MDPIEYSIPHRPGKLKQSYRLINQLVCHNLSPRGSEKHPSERVGKIMWAFGDAGTVCDWALFIFAEMVDLWTVWDHRL